MGIDRDQINEIFFLGTGTVGSAVPSDENRYFPGREWRTKWHTLDIAQANQLLDKIGYAQKDGDGYRLRKDGKGKLQLEFLAVNRLADFPQIAEMLKQHWRKLGIDLVVQTTSVALAFPRIVANSAQMTGNTTGTEDVYLTSYFLRPSQVGFAQIMGKAFAVWEATGGKQGKEPFPAMKQLMELWNRGVNAPEKERIEIGKEVTRMHVDQVFTISLVGQDLSSYGLRLAKTNLGNVPARILNSNVLSTTLNAHPMTFYWK
jgi:peptide/nickel transport system substrate-binding protein